MEVFMPATGPRPRNIRCYGNDFVATAQHFGANVDDAQRMWWRLYRRIKPSMNELQNCSIEVAMGDYLTLGQLYDYFFDNPNGVPTFDRMSLEQVEVMQNSVAYATQPVLSA
jgi:hypothetical protein